MSYTILLYVILHYVIYITQKSTQAYAYNVRRIDRINVQHKIIKYVCCELENNENLSKLFIGADFVGSEGSSPQYFGWVLIQSNLEPPISRSSHAKLRQSPTSRSRIFVSKSAFDCARKKWALPQTPLDELTTLLQIAGEGVLTLFRPYLLGAFGTQKWTSPSIFFTSQRLWSCY